MSKIKVPKNKKVSKENADIFLNLEDHIAAHKINKITDNIVDSNKFKPSDKK